MRGQGTGKGRAIWHHRPSQRYNIPPDRIAELLSREPPKAPMGAGVEAEIFGGLLGLWFGYVTSGFLPLETDLSIGALAYVVYLFLLVSVLAVCLVQAFRVPGPGWRRFWHLGLLTSTVFGLLGLMQMGQWLANEGVRAPKGWAVGLAFPVLLAWIVVAETSSWIAKLDASQ